MRLLKFVSLTLLIFLVACTTNQTTGQTPTNTGQTYTANSYQITGVGSILSDSNNVALYTFKNDQSGVSNCNANCAILWPPLTVSGGTTPTAAPGIAGTIGTITRQDGSTQVTFNGMPLYYYSQDSSPGDIKGNGFNGLWSLVMTNV